MKKNYIVLLVLALVYLTSCSNSPSERAQSSVKSYLKENLKNPSTYEPLSFTQFETLENADKLDSKKTRTYKINHIYNITNSEKDKIKMSITFLLDKDFNITGSSTESINGDYGTLTGNAYWKFNDYVGNKPDAGSGVTLYSLDSIRGELKFQTIADIQGNYKIDKIPPGDYFLIVRSNNATNCPDSHLRNLRIYSSYINQIFGFDINKYKDQLREIGALDSLARVSISEEARGDGRTFLAIDNYERYKEQSKDKSQELIQSFPNEFKAKIMLFTGYSNALDFETVRIEEGRSVAKVADFGITCL